MVFSLDAIESSQSRRFQTLLALLLMAMEPALLAGVVGCGSAPNGWPASLALIAVSVATVHAWIALRSVRPAEIAHRLVEALKYLV